MPALKSGCIFGGAKMVAWVDRNKTDEGDLGEVDFVRLGDWADMPNGRHYQVVWVARRPVQLLI